MSSWVAVLSANRRSSISSNTKLCCSASRRRAFGTFTEAVAVKRFDVRGQPIDLGFRRRVRLREILDLRGQAQCLGMENRRVRL